MSRTLHDVVVVGAGPAGMAAAQTEVRSPDGARLSVEVCLAKADEQVALKNQRQASWYLNQAAMVRWEEQRYEEAISYFTRSLRLNEETPIAAE